jgi:hypothetical protein
MANQATKIIDVTKSFVPVDPKAFPENLQLAGQEDHPIATQNAVFYEGHNFLPTEYGYKSFFGVNAKLVGGVPPTNVDRAFIFKTSEFVNIVVVLGELGIYTLRSGVSSTWVQEVSLSLPPPNTYFPWTYCVIGNDLFCYQQNGAKYYRFSNEDRLVTAIEAAASGGTLIAGATIPKRTFHPCIPNFLNMAGQVGIFKAGSRLGFWDSLNSISWSSIDDFADFTPSVTSLAGDVLFQEVTGSIVMIYASGDGFVIYATRSILYVARDDTASNQWHPQVLLKNAGIAFLKECCYAASDTEQYAYTSIGLFAIKGTTGNIVVPEVIDYLKDTKQPVYLSMMQGRYLFLEILDGTYMESLVTFNTITLGGGVADSYTFDVGGTTVADAFAGNSAGYQQQGEDYRIALGLPAKKSGTSFVPQWRFSVSDKEIIVPGVPIVNQLVLSRVELASMWGLTSTTIASMVAFNPLQVNYPIGYVDTIHQYQDVPFPLTSVDGNCGVANIGSSIPLCNSSVIITHGASHPLTPVYGSFSPLNGADRSGPLPALTTAGWTLSTFTTYQNNLWAARDAEVVSYIAYAGLYSNDIIVSQDEYTANTGNSFELGELAKLDTAGGSFTFTDIDPGVGTNYVLSVLGRWGQSNLSTLFTDQEVTIDSGWTTPGLRIDFNGDIVMERLRGFITSITPKLDVSQQSLATRSPFTQTKYNQRSIASGVVGSESYLFTSILTKAKSTEQITVFPTDSLDNNPSQQARAVLVGYCYTKEDNSTLCYLFTDTKVGAYKPNPVPALALPPSTFTLQNGNIAYAFPQIFGALVYDTQLKKWGKMKLQYKCLLDYSPINVANSPISYNTFGVEAGVVTVDYIAIFDKNPIDSYIKIGKIGYWRQGMTKAEEVRVHFRTSSTGYIQVETSLDGMLPEIGLLRNQNYTNDVQVIMYPDTVGRWHNISLHGIYDIKHIEFRGHTVGNR